jgi:hypothetical protein
MKYDTQLFLLFVDESASSIHSGNKKVIIDTVPTIELSGNSSKYDSLFSESQPVFQCRALVDYETPEKLEVHQGDIIQIWLPTSGMATSDSATTNTENTAVSSSTEWWYGSLASNHLEGEQVYGWLPSTVCEKI